VVGSNREDVIRHSLLSVRTENVEQSKKKRRKFAASAEHRSVFVHDERHSVALNSILIRYGRKKLGAV